MRAPEPGGTAAPWAAPVRWFLEGLDRLLFPLPVHCLACGREAPGQAPFPGGICPACLSAWRLEVAQCPSWPAPWGRVRPVGVYHGALRELIRRFKYGGERWLGHPLGELMAGVGLVTLHRPDLLVPVPLAAGRYRQRGFNQAEELARVVGGRWRVPVVNALGRRRAAKQQAGLGRAARWENLRGAFVPLMDLRGATITVIDDVFTTGATLANCTVALLQAGAVRVDGLVLATVPGDGF